MTLTLPALSLLLAAATSAVLAVLALARRPQRLQYAFGLGMLGFAVEALTGYVLVARTELPEDRLFWLVALEVSGLVLTVPWLVFVGVLAGPRDARMSRPLVAAVGGAGVLALAAAGVMLWLPGFQISDIPGAFHAARLTEVGLITVVAQLLMTVAILVGLELTLRGSSGVSRWRIKYWLLGLGAIFLARFYLLSHVLLFQVLLASYLTIGAVSLVVGALVIGVSLARTGIGPSGVTMSRQMLYRSVIVGALGVYLVAMGGLGWLLRYFGVPDELFWTSLLVCGSALGLAVVLLSEEVRWRVKRFIAVHFYKSKHDYREQWVAFATRISPLLSLETLGPALLRFVTDAVGTTSTALYLSTPDRDGTYDLVGSLGAERLPPQVAGASLVARLENAGRPVLHDNGFRSLAVWGVEATADGILAFHVLVPLLWQQGLIGFILLGPQRAGEPYTVEDLEFLATVGQQAAATVVTGRLSEHLSRAREFEAFHRLTSFVMHDLKNAVSGLSLLSQNAGVHFDDPEFRRDALTTLSATVARMKALMTKLGSPRDSAPLRFERVDVAGLLAETAAQLVAGRRVTLSQHFEPTPPILGDASALHQVFHNLLKNAIEAMDGEGDLTIRAATADGTVRSSITDTGRGMTPVFIRTRLFAPFRSTKQGGWGIGLYQAREVVAAHQGHIEVESEEGKGTTFVVVLPVEPETPGTRPEGAA